MKSGLEVSTLGNEPPVLNVPFAVLLEADDREWSALRSRVRWTTTMLLLDTGCRYFVCSGEKSEALHDHIDDVLIAGEYQAVTTTFHDDDAESRMVESLVLVENTGRWVGLFETTDGRGQ